MNHPATNYPSPAETKIYINNSWIDDAYRVDYTVSNPRTPLYDYTSTFFKDVAEGHTIVHGQLILNFRFPGYLMTAIKDNLGYQKQRGIFKTGLVARQFQSRSLDGSRGTAQSSELIRDLLEGSAQERVSKLLAYKRLGALEHVKQVSDALFGDGTNMISLGGETAGAVATHQGRLPFSITMRYGGEEALYTKTIEECYLVGESQVISASAIAGGDLSASGMPIFEIYSFFGRKVSDTVTEKAVKLNKKLQGRALGDRAGNR
jgi:hypothetical protein